MNEKKKVLILCTGNSARSQMAEGLLRHFGGDRFTVESAGVTATFVRPFAVQAMREIGIDISTHRSKSIEEFRNTVFDFVITVCDNAKETCPFFPANSKIFHWSFDDPAEAAGDKEEQLALFRRIRDEIRAQIKDFIDGK